MNRRLLVVLASLLLMLTTVAPVVAAPGADATGSKAFTKAGTYIVQLAEWPVVAYDGSIAGYKATKPAPGSKIDPASTDVVKYVGYLKYRHDALLKSVGASKKLYDYSYSYNGFAAKLTAAQANKLAVAKGVVAVTPDKLHEVDTSSTPTFLGLTDPGGLWAQLGGPTGTRTVAGAGEGIVIGVVDSGVWPESKSFSDRNANGQLIYSNLSPASFHGKCDGAAQVIDPAWDASRCNKKLVAAQHFNASWGGNAALEAVRPWEFMSPRDYNGHGTHTSSTAGGNFGVQATGPAAGFGTISGMAPRARIAMYKALWSTQDASTASGFTGDLVAAIDRSVADGVDVINYSISGTLTDYLDPAEVSFLFAAAAGIFVSESAGNSGPTTSTVAHPGPWTTTVAAGTHSRNGIGSVTLGNGVTYFGASLAAAVPSSPLIDSTAAGASGASATAVALCYSTGFNGGTPALDPALIAGKIVVCDRGTNGRTDKSLAVQQAGGIGMILLNTSPNSLNADFHFVPTVHLQNTDRAAVKAYAAGVSPTASIAAATVTNSTPAPFTAAFSSRGPSLAGTGDILKPDVIAPGQDILASVAPPGNNGLDFNLYSGTSMSAPHVAGLGALLKHAHPTWTVAMIKSSLMTSAYDVLDAGSTTSRIFSQGAGHVRPNSATNPGLVFDAGMTDWRGFLRSQGLCTFCFGTSPAPVIDPSDFNSASISIGALAGTQAIHRTVKSVGSASETYTFSYTGLAGIDVTPGDASFSIASGASRALTVTFTTNGAALNTFVGGFLTWTGNGGHVVRIPVVVKPVALAAPAAVSGIGGNINYNVTFGYTGAFTATARGLIAPVTTADVVLRDPNQSFDPADVVGNFVVPVTIPAGTSFARFQMFDADVDPGSDIDLYVYLGSTLVGSSAGGSSSEVVSLVNPALGNYTVYVHGWGPANGVSTPFKLYTWVLGTANAGNMTVSAPASATLGTTGTITLSFSGLAPATKYLGSVAYGGIAGMPNPTIVRVDTP